jgi:glycosyltransferase involved in cell wall biosynthesis
MRLAVYCDYTYRIEDGRVYASLPFSLFVQGLAEHCERLIVIGRLDPTPGRFPFELKGPEFVALPHYQSGAALGSVIRSVPSSVRRFWRMLSGVDAVWILGPNPAQAPAFAVLTLLRRKRLVLGVRQHLPALIRHRHPDKPLVRLAALLLEWAFRGLAYVAPVVVVGEDLARGYGHSRALHISYVALLRESDIVTADADRRDYGGSELRLLSVGRLDPEKNPLLLADVLALALRHDPRWRLDVCGDGPLAGALQARLEQLGIADRATLHGYVPIHDGLWDLYRASHALLHISLTEGVPQVLLEAFAARLPVVATDVGGVGDLVRERGWLIPPNDAGAAATALAQLAEDEPRRTELIGRASEEISRHTLDAESAELAEFIAQSAVRDGLKTGSG